MPNVQEGETRSDFISRCIPIVLNDGTAEDSEQAAAICHSIYDDKDKKSYKGVLFKTKDKKE